MAKRVLVTGGAGFIGSELVRQLVQLGHRVTVVDNLVNGRRANLAAVDCELLVADIREPLGARLQGVDVLFHLACLGVRHSLHAPVENHEVNAGATLRLLIAAREAQVGRFVYVSTSEVYGTAQTVPMPETHPTWPCTVYGSSKLAGECYTRAFHHTHGYPTVVIRPFNTYGPRCHHEGDSGEVIPRFLLCHMAGQPMVVFGDGQQTRDFTYVSDTARGIILAGLHPQSIGETFNLGFGAEHTIRSLADHIAALWGVEPRIEFDPARPGDVLRLFADTTRARTLLGYHPTVTLADGLRQLKAWYEADGRSATERLGDIPRHNWEQVQARV